MILIQSLLILLLVFMSDAKLLIKAPKNTTIENQFNQIDGIEYIVLNSPRKSQNSNRLWKGNLIFDSSNEYACKTSQSIFDMVNGTIMNPVMIAPWDECHYYQKMYNVGLAGAKMLIVVLGPDMTFKNPFLNQIRSEMATGVEVVVILKEDGDKLMKALKDSLSDGGELISSAIELHYTYDPKRNIKDWVIGGSPFIDYWITPNDISKKPYRFLEDLRDVLSDFGTSFQFYPRYFLWRNLPSGASEDRNSDERCVSSRRYCDSEPQFSNRLSGKQAVLEALRQICLRDPEDPSTLDTNWWKYIIAYAKECVDTDITENKDCHEKAFKAANIPNDIIDKVNTCMIRSFGVSDYEDLETTFNDNYKLREEYSAQNASHVTYLPCLYVNKEIYNDNFQNKKKLTEFLCSHFDEKVAPPVCKGWLVHTWKDYFVYLGVFLGSLLLMGVSLYCVRRSVKREVMWRMNNEIPYIVTQYKEFKDQSGSGNNNENNDDYDDGDGDGFEYQKKDSV